MNRGIMQEGIIHNQYSELEKEALPNWKIIFYLIGQSAWH